MDKYLIVGLGNKDKKYEKNRHNVGFMVIDWMLDSFNLDMKKEKHKARFVAFRHSGKKIYLAKPQTYMNASGESVNEFIWKEHILPENIIVVYDDIDIDFGTFRFKTKGSAGTHNGMRSIISELGTNEFKRMRVGIGKPKEGKNLVSHVLSDFTKEEQKALAEIVKVVGEKILDMISDEKFDNISMKCEV